MGCVYNFTDITLPAGYQVTFNIVMTRLELRSETKRISLGKVFVRNCFQTGFFDLTL